MGFILGTIVGAAAMWVYGDRLRAYLDNKPERLQGSSGEGSTTAKPSGAQQTALAHRQLGHLSHLGPLHAAEHPPGAGRDQADEI